jgi:hypothetical protein
MKRIMKKEEATQLLNRLINSAIRDVDHRKYYSKMDRSSTQAVVIAALSDYETKLDDLITYLEETQFPEEVEVSKYDGKD